MVMVSIITPCYNSAAFIRDAIESVLSQTYQDWELIIADDCSSDHSVDIILEYAHKDHRIIFLKTEKPSGSPSVLRNLALEHAKGRFISFLDSDDVWLPTKLEEQVKLFGDQQIAVAFTNYEKINDAGERKDRYVIAPKEVGYDALLKGNVIANSTGMYDTQKVGKIFCPYVHHEDYALWLSILKLGYRALNTNKVHTLYRMRKGSVSSNKLRAIAWQWRIYREIEGLGVINTCFYFTHYAVRAVLKRLC